MKSRHNLYKGTMVYTAIMVTVILLLVIKGLQ